MKHYLTTCPIKDFKIATECENMLLPTTEKKERWQNITKKLKQPGNKVKVAEFFLDV